MEEFDKFNYEIVFHKLDMNFAPKNSLLSLTFKRGTSSQESKRKFYLDDQSKQAIINEAFSFKTQLQTNRQRNQYLEKYVEVYINQWKQEKSTIIGALKINVANYPNNNIYARYEQDVPLEKCNDLSARMSYQVKCSKTDSRESSEKRIQSKSPIQGSTSHQQQGVGRLGNSQQFNQQQQQQQIAYKSFAYKHHSELSPVQPKSKNTDQEESSMSPYKEIHQQSNTNQRQNIDEISNNQQGNISTTVSASKALGASSTTKKTPLITINKEKKAEKKNFILINQKKQQNSFSGNNDVIIKNNTQATSQLSNSNISDTTHANSDMKERMSIKQSLQSSAAATSKTKNYLNQTSQSKSPEQSSKLTKNNLLTPRTKTPTPTPRPISVVSQQSSSTKNSSKKEIGYRERSAEQHEQKMLYNSKAEKQESLQKQQVPNKRKFIIEGKRRQEEKQNVKDIQNAELAEKLSFLTQKLRNQSQEPPKEKGLGNYSDQSHNDSNIDSSLYQTQQQKELRDFKKKQMKEISNLDNMINQMKTDPQLEDFESVHAESEIAENGQKNQKKLRNDNSSSTQQVDFEDDELFDNSNYNSNKVEKYNKNGKTKQLNHSDSQEINNDEEFHEEQREHCVIPVAQDLQIERKFTFNSQHVNEQQIKFEEKEKELHEKIQTLEQHIQVLNKTIEQLNVQNQIITNELSSSQQQLQLSNQEKQLLLSSNSILKQQNDDLQNQLKVNQEIYTLKISQIQESAQSNSGTPKELAQQVENTQYMVQQIKILTTQNNDLTNQVKQQQNTIFEYQSHLSEQEKTIEELIFKINQKDLIVNEKSKDMEALKNEIEGKIKNGVQAKNDEIDQIKRAYELQIQELQDKLRLVSEEKQNILIQFQVKQQQFDDKVQELNSQLQEANQRLEQFEQFYQSFQSQGQATSIEYQKALEQIKAMEQSLEINQNEKRMLEEEIETLKQNMNKNEMQLSQSHQRKIEIVEQEKINLQQENMKLSSKVEQLNKQIHEAALNIPINKVATEDFEKMYFNSQKQLIIVQDKYKIELERQQIEFSKLENILKIYQQRSEFLEQTNEYLEAQLIETKEDLCNAMNGILGSQSNEIYDNIEQFFSFRENRAYNFN
ncbi:hypothetical protein TTHERM_00535170 (macronuclear) [Tetrahymena thermophila SB210]|uniref:C2 NT-type domain-containing protein n=1 Tax=Tetrahymena thermophila (strain SB210) TaxID=312017 RepID=I7MA09_TETTS|nr:hypothetical protein TTHERM_00535170 [Tetrahymena thermophila SB210]EAS03181.2 hypothetical protein TTHERM_00535170 [Tetrahymena thermophila SB210]|eukprot:XP_001023426.2 hypothetical protein TTHERM_00535170 [Tetrahymena thermophila SB210]